MLEPGDALEVVVPVRNAGSRAGSTVVRLYVRGPEARLDRPDEEPEAFAKVSLGPGEARDVALALDTRSFACFDDARGAWGADAGEFELLVGTSSADLPGRAVVRLEREWVESVAPPAR